MTIVGWGELRGISSQPRLRATQVMRVSALVELENFPKSFAASAFVTWVARIREGFAEVAILLI